MSVTKTGNAQSVALSATGLPTGVTATFANGSPNSGTNTTLTLSSLDSTTPGTYTVTVTGVGTSTTRSATFALTVRAPVVNSIVNPGFEAGSLINWTLTGPSGSPVTSPAPKSGTYSAQLGATTPTSGDSKIAQTVVAPAGATRLSFWYSVRCLGTTSKDWATATLYDATAAKTTTMLSKTCTNGAGWKQVSVNVVAGRTYTITLVNRDDNSSTTPTYTLYDDVIFS